MEMGSLEERSSHEFEDDSLISPTKLGQKTILFKHHNWDLLVKIGAFGATGIWGILLIFIKRGGDEILRVFPCQV